MATLSEYVRIVRKERPLLADIVDKFGDLDVLSFSQRLFGMGEAQAEVYRQDFSDLLAESFPNLGTETLNQYRKALIRNPLVSTADHHCIINHPVYLNSNLLLSLFSKEYSSNQPPYITPPILSFSGIPLNNAAYPRGILLSTPDGEKRFSFFGAKDRRKTVSSVGSLSFSERQITYWLKQNKSVFSQQELEFVEKCLLDISQNTKINKCSDYSEQIMVFNDWLWEKIAPGKKLNFFPIDTLSGNFLCRVLLKQPRSTLYRFLFDYPLEKQEKLFDGIYGAWNLTKLHNFTPGGGTFYFWGLDNHQQMVPLKRIGCQLAAQNPDFKPLKWDIETIAEALQNRKLIPSLLINYLIIAGHYGLYCSGAFNQIGYLSPILKQYQKALFDMKEDEEAERIEKISANGVHAFLYFLFGESRQQVIPLCSFNLLQTGVNPEMISAILRSVTLKQCFEITTPLTFPFITDPQTRDRLHFSFTSVYSQLKDLVPKKLIVQKW